MDFEWDPEKARRNLRSHGVTFLEASEVFADPLSLTVADPGHSRDERRFLVFGESAAGRRLVVAFADRGGRVRLISAREMTRRERKAYEQ
jgi:uncharacterized protein